jgi:hypothetical protein
MNLLYYCNFMILFETMLFPMPTAELLHLVLYFSTECPNSRQKIIILFWKYLVDIRSGVWLNPFLGINLNGKLFAVFNCI